MLSSESSRDLVNACQVLFSPDANCSLEFISSLKPSTLKVAFRKKAFETHPDRSRVMGRKEEEQNRRFQEVRCAYEVLRPVAAGAKPIINRPRSSAMQGPKTKKPAQRPTRYSSYYSGAIPEQKLLIGQYMYYSGIITWKTLVDALSWQRRLRPLYGQVALAWEMLDRKAVEEILRNKSRTEKFGEYAKRNGYLTGFQHLAIMGKQRQQHRLLGEYFAEKGILSHRQLDTIVSRLERHNQNLGI